MFHMERAAGSTLSVIRWRKDLLRCGIYPKFDSQTHFFRSD